MLVYGEHKGCLIGFVDTEINNWLHKFDAALFSNSLASSMLVLMVRGLFQKVNYCYVQFAYYNLNRDQLLDSVWKAISRT